MGTGLLFKITAHPHTLGDVLGSRVKMSSVAVLRFVDSIFEAVGIWSCKCWCDRMRRAEGNLRPAQPITPPVRL